MSTSAIALEVFFTAIAAFVAFGAGPDLLKSAHEGRILPAEAWAGVFIAWALFLFIPIWGFGFAPHILGFATALFALRVGARALALKTAR